jgi:hypothetical protein
MIETMVGFLVNDPPTTVQIETARDAMDARRRSRNDKAFAAVMAVPIPGLDILAGLATAMVSEALSNDDPSILGWDHEASLLDWSATDTTAAYAAKVKEMGRPLIRAETSALRSHIQSVETAKTTGMAVMNAAGDVFKSFLRG